MTDSAAAFRLLSRREEESLLSRLSETLRGHVSAASLSWLDVTLRVLVSLGAEYQARHLPLLTRRRAHLELRTEAIDSFVRARTSRLLNRPDLIADQEFRLNSSAVALGEVNAALFFGRHQLIHQLIDRNLLLPNWVSRRWVTNRDEFARASHLSLHGQVRPWGLPFSSPVTGASLMHPHDSAAPASEVVNCRCSEVIMVSVP